MKSGQGIIRLGQARLAPDRLLELGLAGGLYRGDFGGFLGLGRGRRSTAGRFFGFGSRRLVQAEDPHRFGQVGFGRLGQIKSRQRVGSQESQGAFQVQFGLGRVVQVGIAKGQEDAGAGQVVLL